MAPLNCPSVMRRRESTFSAQGRLSQGRLSQGLDIPSTDTDGWSFRVLSFKL